jgi:hypothetical protein
MGVYETFSKRMKRISKNGQADVYQYDDLPNPFRVQVIHIWNDALPPTNHLVLEKKDWTLIHDILAREIGVFNLSRESQTPYKQCAEFFLKADTENALDIIELSFLVIDRRVRDRYGFNGVAEQTIEELNHRFREHNIGYQFESGKLIRVDSQFVYAEVVKPALSLLHDAGFRGAEEEFLKAHEHYRHNRHKEAIVEALKAFESTMKAICDARKWEYSPTTTAKTLIDVVFDKGLVPPAMQNYFNALRTTLEAGLPTVRNKTSGHGQGAEPVAIPDYLAAYAVHLAAANIVMLVQAHR